jgi:uncharacterized protein YdcH (DUF465 family)
VNDIKTSWKDFGLTIIYPWAIFFLILTVIFLILQFIYNDPVLNITFSILMALSAGVLGGFATKKWERLPDEKLMINKGHSAIRNLWHIFGGIILTERRVGFYLTRYEDEKESENITKEVIRTYLEEIIEKCINSEVEIINAIEDWSDILPEYADVKIKFAEIIEMNGRYNELIELDKKFDQRIEDDEEITESEINILKRERKELKNEIARLRNELNKKSLQLGTTFVTASPSPSASISGKSFLAAVPSPGAIYSDTRFDITSPSEVGSDSGNSFSQHEHWDEKSEQRPESASETEEEFGESVESIIVDNNEENEEISG